MIGKTISVGMVIGARYVLLSQIAVGGMGEVWRARDILNRSVVAIKILKADLAGQEQFLTRLRLEATNAQRIHHSNLAAVLDSGEQNGLGWLAMELVEGQPLSEMLADNEPLALNEILPIIHGTALALQAVHDAGVVHRDVKPGNILVTADGRVKLTDFGISKTATQETLTQAGMVMGTAQYLAPEQATGNEACSSGDLYALGVIFYEALAGRRPFTGKTQVDIAFAHVNSPIPELPDTVPNSIREVVTKLLAKSPADRPSSAQAVAERLEAINAELGLDILNIPSEDTDPISDPIIAEPREHAEPAMGEVESWPNHPLVILPEHSQPIAETDSEPITSLAGGVVSAPPVMPPSFPPTTAMAPDTQERPRRPIVIRPQQHDSEPEQASEITVQVTEQMVERLADQVAETVTTSATCSAFNEDDNSDWTQYVLRGDQSENTGSNTVSSNASGLKNWLTSPEISANHKRHNQAFCDAIMIVTIAIVLLLIVLVIATATASASPVADTTTSQTVLQSGRIVSCLLMF